MDRLDEPASVEIPEMHILVARVGEPAPVLAETKRLVGDVPGRGHLPERRVEKADPVCLRRIGGAGDQRPLVGDRQFAALEEEAPAATELLFRVELWKRVKTPDAGYRRRATRKELSVGREGNGVRRLEVLLSARERIGFQRIVSGQRGQGLAARTLEEPHPSVLTRGSDPTAVR